MKNKNLNNEVPKSAKKSAKKSNEIDQRNDQNILKSNEIGSSRLKSTEIDQRDDQSNNQRDAQRDAPKRIK
jgi:hypothetical protein